MIFLKNFFNLLLIYLLLSGCASPQVQWFQYQYAGGGIIDALTECAPTTASNNLCWQTGYCAGRKAARATRPMPLWWTIGHIAEYITSKGGTAEIRQFSREDVSVNKLRGNLIFHVNGTHFITSVV